MAGDPEGFDEETSRSIFSAFWFRALLVVIALGIVAVIAVPYVLDMMSSRQNAVTGARPRVTPAPTPTPTPPAPVTPPAPTAQAPSAPAPPAATTEPSKTEMAKTETTSPDAPKPEMAKPAEPAPPSAKAPEPERSTARPDGTSKAVASKPAAKSPMARSKTAAASGPYWVQVGAFREASTAKQVADKLRADNYSVEESTKPGGSRAAAAGQSPSASPGGDRYNVFVSGAAPADVSAKVGTKGFNAEAVAGGVAVRPSLPLKEAVELSRELAGEGMKVQVRRAAAESGGATTSAPAATTGQTWYRVRVGSFPDKAAAVAALKELEGKGYKPFLARGAQ